MKRLVNAFFSDIRYQWRYGFYLIYAFMIAFFIGVIRLLPADWRQIGLTAVLLSDPALLGFFFVGGILQLERGEGLLDALFLSPLRPWEYIVSKGASLGVLATLAGSLIALGSGVPGIRYGMLTIVLFLGSVCFTWIGIATAINLRSMNAYFGVDGLWEMALTVPPMLLLFGVGFPLLEAFPGSNVLRLIEAALGRGHSVWLPAIGLLAWLSVVFVLTHKRTVSALSRLGGGAA